VDVQVHAFLGCYNGWQAFCAQFEGDMQALPIKGKYVRIDFDGSTAFHLAKPMRVGFECKKCACGSCSVRGIHS
jgi:hypothetical protein